MLRELLHGASLVIDIAGSASYIAVSAVVNAPRNIRDIFRKDSDS